MNDGVRTKIVEGELPRVRVGQGNQAGVAVHEEITDEPGIVRVTVSLFYALRG